MELFEANREILNMCTIIYNDALRLFDREGALLIAMKSERPQAVYFIKWLMGLDAWFRDLDQGEQP